MRSLFLSLATIALYASAAVAQFTINTPPAAVQCEPVLITWSGGTAPYFLSILPGNQPSAPPLIDLGMQTGTSYSWLVNLSSGTSVGLTIRDSTGAIAQSAPFTIQTSSITDCIGRASSTASGASTGTGTVAATTTRTTPVTTPTAAPSGVNTPRPSVSATSTNSNTAAAPARSNGVSRTTDVGFAVFVGAALLALFA